MDAMTLQKGMYAISLRPSKKSNFSLFAFAIRSHHGFFNNKHKFTMIVELVIALDRVREDFLAETQRAIDTMQKKNAMKKEHV